jgi:hypothetical protein
MTQKCGNCVNRRFLVSIETFDKEHLGEDSPCVDCKRNPSISDRFEKDPFVKEHNSEEK